MPLIPIVDLYFPSPSKGVLTMLGPAAFEHHSAQLNGVKVHYVMAGNGPAVMLLHGWPQTWFEWRQVMALLVDDYTVIAPDMRGFGYSSKPAGGYDALTMARDLAALTEHLRLAEVAVIGHDWGAVFAYAFAASYRELVKALGIVEMALPGVGVMEQAMIPVGAGNFLWHMGFQSVPDVPELLITGKERPYLRWFFEHFAYDQSAIGGVELDEYVAAITQVGGLRGGLGVYRDFFVTGEQVAKLAKTPLTIPVRAFGGEACLGPMTLQSVQAVAPHAEGGVIERCGHWAAEERPQFVAEMIRELMKAG